MIKAPATLTADPFATVFGVSGSVTSGHEARAALIHDDDAPLLRGAAGPERDMNTVQTQPEQPDDAATGRLSDHDGHHEQRMDAAFLQSQDWPAPTGGQSTVRSVFDVATATPGQIGPAFADQPGTGGATVHPAQFATNPDAAARSAPSQTFYVSPTGSDDGDGSLASPFRTISHAINQAGPGDEVIVKPGIYTESLDITQGGTAGHPLTIRAEEPGAALIRPPEGAWNTVSINANHVIFDGFDVEGGGGDGIEANNVHHITIRNNIVHDSGESGIQVNWSEFITVEGNVTYSNASSGWYSGISIYQSRNITGDTTTPGYRTVVRDNISFDNVTERGQHTDGNGIIIDDFQSTQTEGFPNYTYPTLVENNLVYLNGGKGIQVTWSDNVTVRNNTAWHNNQDPLNTGTWRGELSNSQSSNNIWVNNIAVADPSVNPNNTAIDNTSYGGYRNTVTWANNITYNGTPGDPSVRTDGGNTAPRIADGNKLGIDPGFADAPADFNPRAGSPAIDAGSIRYGVAAEDLDGGDRTVGPVDMGVYENGSGATGRVVTGSDGADTVDGGRGNDTVLGMDGNDLLSGGAGNDLLNGAGDMDKVVFSGSAAIRANLSLFGAQSTGQGKDTLIDIENLQTGSGNDRLKGNSGANVIDASGGNDTISGGAGNDRIKGGVGDDHIDGGRGTDTASYTGSASVTVTLLSKVAQDTGAGRDTIIGIENLVSGAGDDRLKGDGANNTLTAGAGDDILSGGRGNDRLCGGAGSDTMTGGSGHDAFVFNTAARASDIDRIIDFNAKSDVIRLDDSVFVVLPTGSLASGAFVANASGKAGDASDRIIYETDTGHLFYDRDGTGPGQAVRVAVLDADLSLTSDCFVVV